MQQRARLLLGTLVTVQAEAPVSVLEEALDVIAHIGHVMSAHDLDSDLGRLARASEGAELALDRHTVTVLRYAQHWAYVSGGCFNPSHAAHELASQGLRPGVHISHATGTLRDVQLLSAHRVRMRLPVCLDLGGIAKGYAVDQAVAVLHARGVCSALVNAGGDMRALGPRSWPVDVRHAGVRLNDQRFMGLRHLCHGALATSVGRPENAEFVPLQTHGQKKPIWHSATVRARDCMTADVLTKWALQSSLLSPALKANLRTQGAQMWRS